MNAVASPGTAIWNSSEQTAFPTQSGVKYIFWYFVHVPYFTAGYVGGVSTATRVTYTSRAGMPVIASSTRTYA